MGIREYFRQRHIRKEAKRHAKAKSNLAKHKEALAKENKYELEYSAYKDYLANRNRLVKHKDKTIRKSAGKKLSFKEYRAREGFKI